jgi:hypothetical protein
MGEHNNGVVADLRALALEYESRAAVLEVGETAIDREQSQAER